jgi:hypothetical protein
MLRGRPHRLDFRVLRIQLLERGAPHQFEIAHTPRT